MRRRPSAILALALIAGCAIGTAPARSLAAGLNAQKPTHVLFIGNSLTYYNLMPALFGQIAKSRGIDTQARMWVRGGATLKWHWTGGDLEHKLASEKFDVVVIQPQSSEIIAAPDETRQYASLIADAARANGAQVVLYAPWPAKAALAQSDQFAQRYRALAASIHARIAPVFAAWTDVRSQGQELYDASALHPNLAGSYIAACVLFATIFQKDPIGATHTFDVRVPDQSEDFAALRLEHIDEAEAQKLQRAAWRAVQSEPLAR